MFQYTVNNHRLPSNPVVCRMRDRNQVKGWTYMRVTVRCTDKARYGLAAMERRAASVVQYGMLGKPDIYLKA